VHESECVALVGPGERNTLQQQLDGKRAGLPAFGNGLDNLGRNIGESQEPTDVRVTQAEAASNLYRVGISPLSQCEHPRPCSSVSQPGRARTGSFGPGSVHVSPFGPRMISLKRAPTICPRTWASGKCCYLGERDRATRAPGRNRVPARPEQPAQVRPVRAAS